MRHKPIVLLAFLFSFYTAGYGQWELYAQMEPYIYHLLELPADEIVVVGQGAAYWNLEDELPQPKEVEGQWGFLYSSDFINNKIGYLGGGCYFPVLDICDAYALYKTIDGGDNWNRIESPLTFTSFGNYLAIEALSEHELLLLQEYHGLLKLNTQTNEIDSLSIDFDEEANDYRSFEIYDQEHWLISYFYYQADGSYLKYFYTEDAGVSWSELMSDSGHDDHITHAKYISQITWIATSANGKVYSIKDQVRTELFDPGDSAMHWVTDLFIYNEKNIYVATYDNELAASTIYKSTNLGNDWLPEIQIDSVWFREIHFNSPGHGFAIATDNTIWERIPQNTIAQSELDLKVFPNPAHDLICIPDMEEHKNVLVNIFDSAGKLVRTDSMDEGQLSLYDLASGVYIARFFQSNKDLLGQAKFVVIR